MIITGDCRSLATCFIQPVPGTKDVAELLKRDSLLQDVLYYDWFEFDQ